MGTGGGHSRGAAMCRGWTQDIGRKKRGGHPGVKPTAIGVLGESMHIEQADSVGREREREKLLHLP